MYHSGGMGANAVMTALRNSYVLQCSREHAGEERMPRKVRELRADLRRDGWSIARQRGSHETWRHPLVSTPVVLAGKDSDDAGRYQEREVQDAIRASREARKRQQP